MTENVRKFFPRELEQYIVIAELPGREFVCLGAHGVWGVVEYAILFDDFPSAREGENRAEPRDRWPTLKIMTVQCWLDTYRAPNQRFYVE